MSLTPQRTLLLTRPQAQSVAFAAALEAAAPGRFAPVIAPALRIAPVPAVIALDGAQGLVFTSVNGVEAFVSRSSERGLRAWCVGAMTAQAARAAGFAATSADGDVAGLAALIAAGVSPEAGALVHVRGRHAAGDLIGRLAAAGITARALEIYDQIACPLAPQAERLLRSGDLDVLTAFSPRSAAHFALEARTAGWVLGACVLVALSAAASAAHDAPEPGRRVIAAAPTRDSMIAALVGL